jgi:taurine dioxygenase
MSIDVTPTGAPLGAEVRGVDLTAPLDDAVVAELRAAWLEHHVLVFPDQPMDDDDLERVTLAFGGFSEDPFFGPIPGREHVAAVCRRADEQAPLFAEGWHSDWSFLPVPPAGTCLMAVTIPPVGGDTWFADQHLALERMPDDLRRRLEGRMGIHSARMPYAPDGQYGERDHEADRSMDIRPSEKAYETHRHPIIRRHPETGREGLFSCYGYIVGIEGMADEEAVPLLQELYAWQTREAFQYRHRWQPDMLVLWDNRSVLHRATGGYEGHDRMLHRTTVRDRVAEAAAAA